MPDYRIKIRNLLRSLNYGKMAAGSFTSKIYLIKSLRNVTSIKMIWSSYSAYLQSRLRCGIMLCVGELKSAMIFRLQKKVIRLITGVHKRESCRHIFRKFQILTLASLYILDVLCFIKHYQRNLKQNFGIHVHNTRNRLYFRSVGPRTSSTRVALLSQYALPCSTPLPTVQHAFYPYCTSSLPPFLVRY